VALENNNNTIAIGFNVNLCNKILKVKRWMQNIVIGREIVKTKTEKLSIVILTITYFQKVKFKIKEK
jgi:hypothetical protein